MSFSFRSTTPPAIKNIIIINVLFFLASIGVPKYFGFDFMDFFGLHYFESEKFNPIQLVSYMFLHDTSGFSHIFFNMFGLWMFGRGIEEIWGTRKFLIFYFVSGIGAALVQEVTWYFSVQPMVEAFNGFMNTKNTELLMPYLSNVTESVYPTVDQLIEIKGMIFDKMLTVGASGCVFGILLAFAMLFPQAEIFLLFIPIPIKAPIFVTIYAVMELFLGVQSFSGDNVAHFAHLGGMLFALILILVWRKKGNLY